MRVVIEACEVNRLNLGSVFHLRWLSSSRRCSSLRWLNRIALLNKLSGSCCGELSASFRRVYNTESGFSCVASKYIQRI